MKNPKQDKPNANNTTPPANPLPAPNLGDANQMQPSDSAQQATWQTYKSSTAHAEPPGHLDEDGIKDVDNSEHPHAPRMRHGDDDKFPAADHDAKRRERE